MPSFNKVIILGNLTSNPELRQTQSGTSILKVNVGINESYVGRDGNKEQRATFVELSAFGRIAENIAKYFYKGQPILVEGRLRQENWKTKEGENRSKLVVVVEGFEFVANKEKSATQTEANETASNADEAWERTRPHKKPTQQIEFDDIEDADVPF